MLLAIDIGFSNYGCTVLDFTGMPIKVGTMHTQKTKQKLLRVADDDTQRITQLSSGLSRVISENGIKGVFAELPPSASQSAVAAKALGMAVALTVATLSVHKIPVEWATPNEVKKALTGKANASKEEIMAAVCKKYNWAITEKSKRSKKTGQTIRYDKTYHPLGQAMGKNDFEHIADSLCAFEALKHTNLARMFLKPKK